MKNLVLTAMAIIALMAFTTGPKPIVAKFKVFGNCPQCKDRVETALDVKGVKSAEWNVESKIMEVVYLENKITLEKIHQIVAQSGHDTEIATAPDSVYLKLPECCMYRDNDHTHFD